MRIPVGISARCMGASVTGSSKEAWRSTPAESGVAYFGNGWRDVLTIFTFICGLWLWGLYGVVGEGDQLAILRKGVDGHAAF